ncbi:uracil-DNA glycosylase [Oceanicoccus sagamiensis]|uniref:Uracil-DNA glycosylase n=1 Tax=Oceanicoccus sagamiensis TaxID=716816 RepID=A0A1X9NE68_9GAMM|nr:uracil-DNA glycosylase [Oceanicoccus sagamiensis]ARN75344.1 uracil-DNA glycosylase [Oceanicoccus sagamiensis]
MSNNSPNIKMDPSWLNVMGDEFEQPYMQALKNFLQAEKQAGKVIYPPCKDWFNAFNTTPFDQVKIVVLGQDPYHGPGQAHGLCFSVLPGIRIPPSLLNIYKEIHADMGLPIPAHGCLQSWAEQGVLLLNATLTVEQANAGAHQHQGWEQFTDRAIAQLNAMREGLVFLLWGSYAQKKGQLIDSNKHLVLKAPHPSPLSAHRGFLGCRHFSQANAYLQQQGKPAIDWSV